MRGRRTTTGFITAMAVAGLLAAGTSADAKPKPKPRPNLGIVAIRQVPDVVQAGTEFAVRVTVSNEGTAAAPATQLSMHLSRDTKKSSGDLNVGRTSVGKLADWTIESVWGPIDLPESAIGEYYVIACADAARKVRETRESDNCIASTDKVEAIVPLEGVLTGTLDFYDSDEIESGSSVETWSRHAQAEIRIEVGGRGSDIRVVDGGSSYTWGGDYAFTIQYPDCVYKRSQTEERADDFLKPGERISDLKGTAADPTLEIIDLEVKMEYDVTGSLTTCGQPPVPYTDELEYTTGVSLQKIPTTDDTIRYEASSHWTGEGEPSAWDSVEGTFVFELD